MDREQSKLINPAGGNLDGIRIKIKLTGNAQDGSNIRWKYSWVQTWPDAADGWTWNTLTGGLSGSTSTFSAYNTQEAPNGSSGLLGNGVTVANLGSCNVKPITTGDVFDATVYCPPNGTPRVYFSASNGVDT